MNESVEYVAKVVKILDAVAKQDLGDKDEPKFVQKLLLLLQDTETNVIFQAELEEPDVRKIIKFNQPLNSKQMIDLATALRDREQPLKLLVPKSSTELSVDDVIKSRSLDLTKKKRRNRNRKNKQRQSSTKNYESKN
jgi:hypothetical protein